MKTFIRVECVDLSGEFFEKSFSNDLLAAKNFAQYQLEHGAQEVFILDQNDSEYSNY